MSFVARITGGRFGWGPNPGRPDAAAAATSSASFIPDVRSALIHLTRQERSLSSTEFLVLLLTAAGFVIATWPHSLRDYDLPFHIRPAEAIIGLLGLLLLFQAHAAHRHWHMRGERKLLFAVGGLGEDAGVAVEAPDGTRIGDAASLFARKHIEEQLGREIGRARRSGRPLSLLILSVDDMQLISQRYGDTMAERVLQEFGLQLKRATRGCDFTARFAGPVFLAVLWDCPVGSVQRVLERVSPLVLTCEGKEIPVACSPAWVDFQAGESPAEFITRAEHMLQLYKKLDQGPAGPILTAH